MLYVGWADTILTPSEAMLLRRRIGQLEFLTNRERDLLERWTNPKTPPSAEQFKEWVSRMQKAATQLPVDKRQSLVDLGLKMAQLGDMDSDISHDPHVRAALDTVAEALDTVDLSGYRHILTKRQRERAKAIRDEPSFDVLTMRNYLDGSHIETRNRVRTLLKDPVMRSPEFVEKTHYREWTLARITDLAEQGWGALAFPEAYGGEDDMGKYIAVFETLGYGDLSVLIKFGVQFGLFGGSVQWLGTEYHHEKYLQDIGDMELPGCFAMTEINHGSNVRGLETTGTYDPDTDEIVVHSPNEGAGKIYIGNALHGRMASVFCQLIVAGVNYGVHAVLVPLRDEQGNLMPGVRHEDNGYKIGLNGVDNGQLWFDQVRVPRRNLLNRFGDINDHGQYTSPIRSDSRRFFTMLGTLVGGRVCVPAAGLSAAKRGLSIAVEFAIERRQFGPDDEEEYAIMEYPSHQRRLMPLVAKAYALNFGLHHLAERFLGHTDKDIREIESLAAGMKAYATWFTSAALQECREACGGKAYLWDMEIGQLRADTDIFTTFEGDNTVLMQLVAKGILSSYRDEFNNDRFTAIIRHLRTRFTDTITEYNPLHGRSTDPEHLRSSEFHLAALEYRLRNMTASLANRMRAMIRKRMDPFDSFLRVQNHALELAEAFIEFTVLEQFTKAVADCPDEGCRAALENCRALYALHTIEKNSAWYLERTYYDGVQSKAIRKQVDVLCALLRRDAGILVEAFGAR